MVLQALNEIITIHDGLGDAREHVRVGLNLDIQIARDVGEVYQRQPNLIAQLIQIGIHIDQE
jgi:hypothetical protein